MGTYVNPGNDGFKRILAGEYVDKTGLIALVNGKIGTYDNLVCSTRPRRFGKTFAAESLVAYYSCGCDSSELFEGLAISRDPSFGEHLNVYNVVRLDMMEFRDIADVADAVAEAILSEVEEVLPGVGAKREGRTDRLCCALADFVDATGRKLVFVIDEWDVPLRERRDKKSQEDWVYFLRLLFKNANFTPKVVAACYMTGILPIMRLGTQSSLNNFWEYTFLDPGPCAPYVGFTEAEVEALAARHHMDMAELRRLYDGYEFPWFDKAAGEHKVEGIYAPFSVMCACDNRQADSYWVDSEPLGSLLSYVDMDFDGLRQAIVQVVGGASVRVNTRTFGNDMHDVRSADNVLTLLCHLGYLNYLDVDSYMGKARVPNEEIRSELRNALSQSRHAEVARIVRESGALLRATLDMGEDAVSEAMAHAHDWGCVPTYYNDEQSLRAVVRAAYIAAEDRYASVCELPSGRGVADVVYLPKPDDPYPVLVVELRWDKKPDSAIERILDKDYPEVLWDWRGPILLAGITYDNKTKEHSCRIVEA